MMVERKRGPQSAPVLRALGLRRPRLRSQKGLLRSRGRPRSNPRLTTKFPTPVRAATSSRQPETTNRPPE